MKGFVIFQTYICIKLFNWIAFKMYNKINEKDRRIIFEAYENDEDWRSLAATLGVNKKTAYVWLSKKQKSPKKRGGGGEEFLKRLLDYAIKIAATWVACQKLQARIARPFTLRIQHQAIFKRVYWLDFQQRFGDCVPICDCVSKIWHCISTKFYEIYS